MPHDKKDKKQSSCTHKKRKSSSSRGAEQPQSECLTSLSERPCCACAKTGLRISESSGGRWTSHKRKKEWNNPMHAWNTRATSRIEHRDRKYVKKQPVQRKNGMPMKDECHVRAAGLDCLATPNIKFFLLVLLVLLDYLFIFLFFWLLFLWLWLWLGCGGGGGGGGGGRRCRRLLFVVCVFVVVVVVVVMVFVPVPLIKAGVGGLIAVWVEKWWNISKIGDSLVADNCRLMSNLDQWNITKSGHPEKQPMAITSNHYQL